MSPLSPTCTGQEGPQGPGHLEASRPMGPVHQSGSGSRLAGRGCGRGEGGRCQVVGPQDSPPHPPWALSLEMLGIGPWGRKAWLPSLCLPPPSNQRLTKPS